MISAPRQTKIASRSGGSVVPSEWHEVHATTMLEDAGKYRAPFTTATSETEWESSLERNEYAVVWETIVATMLMVVSVLGNAVVICTTEFRIRRASRLSSFYFLLGHLAIAGLIISCVFLPMEMGWIGMESQGLERSWAAENEEGCKAVGFFHVFAWFLSSFTTTSIILERYWAYMRPLDSYPAVDRARAIALVAWIASALCSLPEAIFYHVEMSPFDGSAKMCTPQRSWRLEEFEWVHAVCKMFVVYGTLIFTILNCCPKLVRHMRTMQTGNLRGNYRANSIRWAKLCSIQLCLTIALAFLICWTPYHVWTLLNWIDVETPLGISESAVKMIQFLACVNSCFNPIVHVYFRFLRRQVRTRAERVPTQMTWL